MINLKTSAPGGDKRLYHDLTFRVEDAVAAILTVRSADLVGAGIVPSLDAMILDDDYVTVVADTAAYSDGPRLSGNWDISVTIRVATYVENSVPDGFSDMREVHRQRVGVCIDSIMQGDLDAQLSDDTDPDGFTCQGFYFGKQSQGVEGHLWVTEITFTLTQCHANN